MPARKDAQDSPDAGQGQHSCIWVIRAAAFKLGFYLYLSWQSLLLGPVSRSPEVFPLVLVGLSPFPWEVELGAWSDFGAVRASPSADPLLRGCCISADTGIAACVAGQKQCQGDSPWLRELIWLEKAKSV